MHKRPRSSFFMRNPSARTKRRGGVPDKSTRAGYGAGFKRDNLSETSSGHSGQVIWDAARHSASSFRACALSCVERTPVSKPGFEMVCSQP